MVAKCLPNGREKASRGQERGKNLEKAGPVASIASVKGRVFLVGVALAACCGGSIIARDSAAQAGPTESAKGDAAPVSEKVEPEEQKEFLNAFSFGGAYALQLDRDRNSETTGEPLRTRENLGGFVIAYERELLPKRLSLGISKPFYFNPERFDTPFEVMLKGLFVRGSWEAFLGPVLTWNIRIFEQERAEQEGEKNKMSFGIGAVTGAAYYFTRRWGLELELAYEYIPTDDIVEHEISAALTGVFRF